MPDAACGSDSERDIVGPVHPEPDEIPEVVECGELERRSVAGEHWSF
jgi:hypothetical protein